MQPSSLLSNPWRSPGASSPLAHSADEAVRYHRSVSGYTPTPLVSLPSLASDLGIGSLALKDESARFGLNAFKGLGASWAIHSLSFGVTAPPRQTFATATDGNHGRAVAWAARLHDAGAVVYVPKGTASARIEAIRGENAGVVIVDGTYDEATARAATDAAANGWILVQDSAWPGYEEIPRRIMEGYLTLFAEIEEQRAAISMTIPDVVFLQAGVGSFAAAGAAFIRRQWGEAVRIVIVEPLAADCLFASAASPAGTVTSAAGPFDTIMAGLNCGTPSTLAWQILRNAADLFMAIDDEWARQAMRRLWRPDGKDRRIVSGESGAAGLGALRALRQDPACAGAAERLGLDRSSAVLLVSTEGDTDPETFQRIVGD
jgi:diaminopropionate ammonia-lyase